MDKFYKKVLAVKKKQRKQKQKQKSNLPINNRPIFPAWLDIIVTLRCNAYCLNCIKMCNTENITGLDYTNTDLTMTDIEKCVNEIELLGRRKHQVVFDRVFLTGGEPTLNKSLRNFLFMIMDRLVKFKYINQVHITSNCIDAIDQEIRPWVVLLDHIAVKPSKHNTVFIHPSEIDNTTPTFNSCRHYRKHVVVFSQHGWSVCCAGDAYMRLFREESCYVKHLPESYQLFPLVNMDKVCKNCPFGLNNIPFQRDLGRPVSSIYLQQGKINKYS